MKLIEIEHEHTLDTKHTREQVGDLVEFCESVVTPWNTRLLQASTGTNRNSGVAAFLQTTPGATGLRQWLNNGGSSGAEWHTVTVAVRPL